MNHSPEPWTAFERDDRRWEIDHGASGGITIVDDGLFEADVKRIVACVNFLAGVPTSILNDLLNPTLAAQGAVAECSKVDRYGREVCRVLVDGADVCLAQIQAGMAWYFRRYAKELPPDRREQYADAEAQAKTERRGLWGDAAPVPPWEWRRPK